MITRAVNWFFDNYVAICIFTILFFAGWGIYDVIKKQVNEWTPWSQPQSVTIMAQYQTNTATGDIHIRYMQQDSYHQNN